MAHEINSFINLGVILAIASIFCQLANADTPANCSYEEILGRWIFSETERTANKSEDCTDLGPVVRKVTIDLEYPDIAIDIDGNHGHWTLVYNQGFEVTVNQRKYFAFSYYEQKEDNVTSFCDRTFNGWSHDVLVRNWACYNGQKVNPVPPHTRNESSYQASNGVFHNNKYFINAINEAQKSWTASHYKQFEGLHLEDIIKMKGGRKSRIVSRPRPAPITPELEREVSMLPDKLDWRNVSGRSFVTNVRNQYSCGSCYAFSALGQIESRLRIMTNNSLNVFLSPQEIVDCSEYSQRCDGGFPYLIAGKYAQDFGVVEENCKPYIGMDFMCNTRPCIRHYVSHYQYVGGYYGACNEASMRLALVTGGPISVSFEAKPDFMHYRSGIYKHTKIGSGFEQFELVNHAVLLVGYGADANTGEKYWIVKNSWGEDWGEYGYFRISRGNDECGIESIAVEIIPIPY